MDNRQDQTPSFSAAVRTNKTMIFVHQGANSLDRDRPGPKKLWNFEARACIGLQKNLDFINKNVRLD